MPYNFNQLLRADTGALVNFDYFDIAEGTGIKQFYFGDMASGAVLRTSQFYSQNVATSGASSAGAFTKVIDKNFDVKFNFPKIVEGSTIVSIPFMGWSKASQNAFFRCDCALLKESNGIETQLAYSSGSLSIQINNIKQYRLQTFNFSLPRTNFKSGDKLRARLEGWAYRDVGAAAEIYLAHSPYNINASEAIVGYTFPDNEDKTAIIQVPFKLDIG